MCFGQFVLTSPGILTPFFKKHVKGLSPGRGLREGFFLVKKDCNLLT